MDFYHVLPSNTSRNYFPNNTASCYSTPLDDPYDLPGEWEVGLLSATYTTCINTFNNDKIIVTDNDNSKMIVLPPCSFQEVGEAVLFLNSNVNDKRIKFSYNSTKQITVSITDAALTVIFDDALSDILAFDKDSFTGPISYTGTAPMSLTRCIQSLYIYSNIGSNVRVGNTEAPLLAIVPFPTQKKCKMFTEKSFKSPMYIHVKQNRLSQIDVGIYDGAGDLVPFVPGAVTTLHLHFRQI